MTPLDERLLQELGPDAVSRDPALRSDCSHDESEQEARAPDAIVTPVDPLQIEILMRLAQEHRFFVTPRGAGTGKSGGSVPVQGGVVLSLHRMRSILEVDAENLLAVAEPGATTESLQRAAEAVGLFYPPDPASLATCSLGGNVAENAGGPRAFRYGVTREYVLGLEVVRIGGQRFDVGHRPVKGVSGYDLTALLTGSEGTLAVFSKLIFKLIPRPEAPGLLILYFSSIHDAVRAVTLLVQNQCFPMALELLDQASLDAARTEAFAPPDDARGALFIELEGLGASPGLARTVLDALTAAGCRIIGQDLRTEPDDAQTAWSARRDVSLRLKERWAHKISEDVAVPRALLPELVLGVQEIAAELGLRSACYGHAGDGNLHVNFLSDDGKEAFGTAVERLFRITLLLGGTLSGEHGIGTLKKRFLPSEHAPAALSMFASIKHAWDPQGLLNPGKIL